jgi:4-hydroxy-tetrahydrodipicolinate reductase
MRIALLGYGKMGKAIETSALERGHSIVAKINSQLPLDQVNWSEVDVCIEFTRPELAPQHIAYCAQKQVPIVVGTTAWQAALPELITLVLEADAALLYASNFSVGVNLFFELNSFLAKLMAPHRDFKIAMEEIHHTQKLDAPSGTAITLANGIIEHTHYNQWTIDTPQSADDLKIQVQRIDNVPGTHSVQYNSPIDTIEIKHTAHSREGFALGAVIAAEWVVGKKGVYTMKDVLGLS